LPASAKAERAKVPVQSRAELRLWLAEHHMQRDSIWLVTYKKGHPSHVPYDAIVEEALCFGWVDSLPRKLDADQSMILLSPRKPKSGWSGVNKQRIKHLMACGLMMPPGQAKIDAAIADGSWVKLDEVAKLVVPSDLAQALAEQASAAENFSKFPASARRGILEWITNAVRPETRAARITETATRAARNERANQWRQPV
jgi:uncharacterized protein YdeI (YjbR/CyaY-like superfamily)